MVKKNNHLSEAKQTMAYQKSYKVIEAEKWVEDYIAQNGYSPTYEMVGVQFGISRQGAEKRCRYIKEKMGHLERVDKLKTKYTLVSLKYRMPDHKMERFAKLLIEINNLLKEK